MRILGIFLVVFALILPLYWFSDLARDWDVFPVFSQYLGVLGLISMGLIQLLATRLSFLESIFGSLDRIYILHKWLGIGALAAVFLHNTIDAEIDGAIGGWFQDFGESLGGTSFDMLQVLVIITLITLIPYHWWRWTHKLMGVLYILAVAHFAMIDKPFSNTEPLAVYTFIFCGVGVLSYLYTLLPLGMLRKSQAYTVDAIEPGSHYTSITMTPQGKGLKHHAGQFAFIQFDQPGLSEVHPYTISQAPQESRELRFTIKCLGDHTRKLHRLLKEGTRVKVTGPYGHFRLKYGSEGSLWVAAGVGITPFLAMAQALPQNQKPVDLFYCVRSRQEAIHLQELEALARNNEHFSLHLVESTITGRLTPELIVQQLGERWPKVSTYYCGPKSLRASLLAGLKARGLPRRRFHFEEFEIRSGIGLDKIILWLAPRALNLIKKVTSKNA